MGPKRGVLAASIVVLLGLLSACAVPHPRLIHKSPSPEITEIVDHYVEAAENHAGAPHGASMRVDITAAIPKLKQHGTLRALRKISSIGKITYQLLGFEGSNTVKTQVIVRYLQAEKKEQGNKSLAILPSNYKFKYKGEKQEGDARVYVFDLSPWKKRIGLFKGQIWLDTQTYLPIFEKGKLVKNPSIFFKKVEFERAYSIQNGVAVPRYMNSIIDAHLVGKVELSISYFNYEPASEPASGGNSGGGQAAAMTASTVRK